jgi:23S rRNA pseudouridine2605 synthase
MNNNKSSERISKVIARSTSYSRRQVEHLVSEGRVKIDGKIITKPGVNVSKNNTIHLDNKIVRFKNIDELYIFNKPRGCLVTHSDPKRRKTIFNLLPKQFEKLISIGRLDYNSEGLILLTNNGDLKRNLELPKNNFERIYKVKVQGKVDPKLIDRLKRGFYANKVKYKSIIAKIDNISETYCWLTIKLKEGKNREIRNIFESVNMTVTRLIRISYGPYKLGKLQKSQYRKINIIE